MGPIYHLTSEVERKKVLHHCLRILKKGGYLITIFMSMYPLDKHNCQLNETITYTHFNQHLVHQYRSSHANAKNMLETAGFSYITSRNIEGIASKMNDEELNRIKTPKEIKAFQLGLWFTCNNKEIYGQSDQFVIVSKKEC